MDYWSGVCLNYWISTNFWGLYTTYIFVFFANFLSLDWLINQFLLIVCTFQKVRTTPWIFSIWCMIYTIIFFIGKNILEWLFNIRWSFWAEKTRIFLILSITLKSKLIMLIFVTLVFSLSNLNKILIFAFITFILLVIHHYLQRFLLGNNFSQLLL